MDSDSDQSQEMFSEDELVTDDCGDKSPKADVSFVSCSQSSISHGFSSNKEYCGSPEIPKTPLSLGPFISKAEVWTSDLETPEAKKPAQYGYFSSERKGDANSRIIDKRAGAIYATPSSVQDVPTGDEIIPASQTIPIERDKKRPNRRIIDKISDNNIDISRLDKRLETQDILGIIEEAQFNDDSESRDRFRLNDDSVFHEEKLKGSRIDTESDSIEGRSPTTLAKRVRQLKELQNERMRNKNHIYISDEEFTKTLKSLASPQNFIDEDKNQPQKSTNRSQLGFIPFSHIPIELKDNCRNPDEGCTKNLEESFHGFTKNCQVESEEHYSKFHDFLCEINRRMPNNSPKLRDGFAGFSAQQYLQSHSIAKKYKFIYDKYLDNNHRIFKRPAERGVWPVDTIDGCLSPLSLSVDTGIRTAYGDEIFIGIDKIFRSKSSFIDIESNLTEHSIDELVDDFSVRYVNPGKTTIPPQHKTKNHKQYLRSINIDVDYREPERTEIASGFNVFHAANEIINNHESVNIMDGFKTARGTCLRISEQALKRANAIFNEENDIDLSKKSKDDVLAKSMKSMIMKDETVPVRSNKFEGVSEPRNITHIAESNEKTLFEDENDLFTNNLVSNPSVMGFQTGRGKSIDISKSALLKATSVFAEDLKDDSPVVATHIPCHGKENSIKLSNMGQNNLVNKRKYPVDEDTPVGRKKLRTGTDLQGRKLFCEIEEEDIYLAESHFLYDDQNCLKTDRNIKFSPIHEEKSADIIPTTSKNPNVNNMSEVEESVAALLKDEESSSETSEQWSNNFVTDMRLLKNRRSEGFCWQRSDIPSEKRSRSFPGVDRRFSFNAKLPVKPPSPKNEDIPEDILFDSPFTEDLMDPQVIEQNRQKRLAAIAQQQALIGSKKTRRVHQVIKGSLLKSKEVGEKIHLKNLFKGGKLIARTLEQLSHAGIDPHVVSIDSETAIDYQFHCVDFFGQAFMNNHCDGIPLTDDAILISNDDNLAGLKEFKQCFLASPGVDVSLVPNGYVENHYRWIVWKLAALDRLRVDDNVAVKFLTPDRVMQQLKYRYDREIDRSQRPALRRILEKDDTSTRRLVLCVSRIFTPNNDDQVSSFKSNQPTIELTDGWYSVRAMIDYAMIENIKKGKVKVGTKLMTYGAELLNLDEGRYPLDITDEVRLKIHTNSTRRVKWYTKLGYQRQSGPMQCNLKSINPNGGLIGRTTVAVARVYPIIYREKIGDGQFIDRNARCEEKISIAYEAECQSRIEAMCADTRECRGGKWKTEMENRMKNNLPVRRDITPITKIKVADGDCAGLITLWSGAEESQSVFKENTLITIRNALASGKKLNELQITANRYTNFQITNTNITTISSITCPERIFTSLDETYGPRFNPSYGEFDTIGVIVSIGPAPHGMKNFETVNLAFKTDDSEQSPSCYLSILFWQGISSFGFADIATVGSFVACCNLEWRRNTYKSIPTAFCTERTVLTRNPKQSHLCQPFEDLRARIEDTESYVATCALVIQNEIMKKSRSSMGSLDNTPCSEKKNISCWTPHQADNDSKLLVTPNSTLRNDSKSVTMKSRMDKLRNYGTPPSLSPIHIEQTPKISLDYRSPITRPLPVLKPHTK